MKRFENIFAITKTDYEAKTEFINRMNNQILDNLEFYYGERTYHIFKSVCFELGIPPESVRSGGMLNLPTSELSRYTGNDFLKTLKTLVALSSAQAKDYDKDKSSAINAIIQDALQKSNPPLPIRWQNGMFYPISVEIIDEKLIDENLTWLNDYPAAKDDFSLALNNYAKGDKYGIIENCYMALENLSQILCRNKTPLHKNQDNLIKNISLSQQWKEFLYSFINYTNDMRRHGKQENRHDLDAGEVEAYFFLSTIFMRLILKKTQSI